MAKADFHFETEDGEKINVTDDYSFNIQGVVWDWNDDKGQFNHFARDWGDGRFTIDGDEEHDYYLKSDRGKQDE